MKPLFRVLMLSLLSVRISHAAFFPTPTPQAAWTAVATATPYVPTPVATATPNPANTVTPVPTATPQTNLTWRSFLATGNLQIVAQAGTRYYPINGGMYQSNTTEASVLGAASQAFTAKNLYCRSSAAQGASKTAVITLRSAGSGTTLTCTMSNATTCEDTTHTPAISKDATLSLSVVITAGGANGYYYCMLEADPA